MKYLFNFMRIQYCLLTFIGFVCINSSCSSSSDEDGTEIIPAKKAKNLSMIEVTGHKLKEDDYLMMFQYDEKGRLVRAIIPGWDPVPFIYKEQQMEWTWRYQDDDVTYEHVGYIQNSRVIYTYSANNDEGKRDLIYKYDHEGKLISMSSMYFDANGNFEWEENNIVKTYEGGEEGRIKYTKNKSYGLTCHFEFNPIYFFEIASYKWRDNFVFLTGLCGQLSEYLPSEMELVSDGIKRRKRTFDYKFDSLGYPVNVKINDLSNGKVVRTLEVILGWE
ncbi:MAG: DUF4595 domain-containing protein [Bacteroidaceae bacterium]|nr:DUF4595 domain-containing protein [Bacteroidaceae bacterium]